MWIKEEISTEKILKQLITLLHRPAVGGTINSGLQWWTDQQSHPSGHTVGTAKSTKRHLWWCFLVLSLHFIVKWLNNSGFTSVTFLNLHVDLICTFGYSRLTFQFFLSVKPGRSLKKKLITSLNKKLDIYIENICSEFRSATWSSDQSRNIFKHLSSFEFG